MLKIWGKSIKKVNFGEIPGFQPGTFRLRDQRATTALSFSLNHVTKKVVFIIAEKSSARQLQ